MNPRPAPANNPSGPDRVDHPNPLWVVLVIGGLGLLWLQGYSADFHGWWSAHVHALPPQHLWRWLFVACVPIHVAEAVYSHRLARRLGLVRSAAGWSASAFFLGWPSVRLLKLRANADAEV